MPMLVVSDEEFNIEQERIADKKVVQTEVLSKVNESELPARGRGHTKEVPDVLRKLVSTLAIQGGNHAEIAKEFKVSESSVSAYKHGATSTASYNRREPNLTKHNNQVRSDIAHTAAEKLSLAMGYITAEKLEAARLRDVSAVVKDMSAVMHNMQENIVEQNNQIIVYQPRMNEIEHYEEITVLD